MFQRCDVERERERECFGVLSVVGLVCCGIVSVRRNDIGLWVPFVLVFTVLVFLCTVVRGSWCLFALFGIVCRRFYLFIVSLSSSRVLAVP